jgi:hypothetical protein
MGLWGRIRRWLFTARQERHRNGRSEIYPLDIDSIAEELNLVEEAKKLGEFGIPAPEQNTLTGPEAKAVQRIEQVRNDYLAWASLRLSVLNEDLARRDVVVLVNRALQSDKTFERKASALLARDEATLKELARAAQSRQNELDAFLKRNSIDRRSHVSTLCNSLWPYSRRGRCELILFLPRNGARTYRGLYRCSVICGAEPNRCVPLR